MALEVALAMRKISGIIEASTVRNLSVAGIGPGLFFSRRAISISYSGNNSNLWQIKRSAVAMREISDTRGTHHVTAF